MKNVGVVDAQYIVHLGLPTLGIMAENEATIHQTHVNGRVLGLGSNSTRFY